MRLPSEIVLFRITSYEQELAQGTRETGCPWRDETLVETVGHLMSMGMKHRLVTRLRRARTRLRIPHGSPPA